MENAKLETKDINKEISESSKVEYNGRSNNINLQTLGVNVSLSQVIADAIAKNFSASLSDKEMNLINDFVKSILFEERENYLDGSTYTKLREKIKKSNQSSYWNSNDNYVDNPIMVEARKLLEEKYNKDLAEAIKAYINSDEYKIKIDEMAQDVCDYAIEGYKKDMKERILSRFTDGIVNNNTPNAIPFMYAVQDVVNTTAQKFLHDTRGH